MTGEGAHLLFAAGGSHFVLPVSEVLGVQLFDEAEIPAHGCMVDLCSMFGAGRPHYLISTHDGGTPSQGAEGAAGQGAEEHSIVGEQPVLLAVDKVYEVLDIGAEQILPLPAILCHEGMELFDSVCVHVGKKGVHAFALHHHTTRRFMEHGVVPMRWVLPYISRMQDVEQGIQQLEHYQVRDWKGQDEREPEIGFVDNTLVAHDAAEDEVSIFDAHRQFTGQKVLLLTCGEVMLALREERLLSLFTDAAILRVPLAGKGCLGMVVEEDVVGKARPRLIPVFALRLYRGKTPALLVVVSCGDERHAEPIAIAADSLVDLQGLSQLRQEKVRILYPDVGKQPVLQRRSHDPSE